MAIKNEANSETTPVVQPGTYSPVTVYVRDTVGAIFLGILARRKGTQDRFTLPRAREIARLRLQRMETTLQWLNEESFGIL